jgi:hypothetical protein
MKKKLSVKTIVILVVLLVVVVLGVIGIGSVRTFMSGATSATEPKGVAAISSADGKSATITWTSDKTSIAKVEYGTTAASLVLMAAETDTTMDHRLSLTSLRPNTTYYYRIRVGEDVFDNSGIPYTFKTKGEEVVPTVIPTVAAVIPTAMTPVATSTATTCVGGVDYNKDGVINSFDIISCKSSNAGAVKGVSTSVCADPSDLNKDGVVNSVDIIKCLQGQKK